MNIKLALKMAISTLKKRAEEKPSGGYNTSSGKVTYTEVANSLRKVEKWAYSKIDDNDIELVVRCKNCSQYTKNQERAKGDKRVVKRCTLHDIDIHDDFYCRDGLYHYKGE